VASTEDACSRARFAVKMTGNSAVCGPSSAHQYVGSANFNLVDNSVSETADKVSFTLNDVNLGDTVFNLKDSKAYGSAATIIDPSKDYEFVMQDSSGNVVSNSIPFTKEEIAAKKLALGQNEQNKQKTHLLITVTFDSMAPSLIDSCCNLDGQPAQDGVTFKCLYPEEGQAVSSGAKNKLGVVLLLQDVGDAGFDKILERHLKLAYNMTGEGGWVLMIAELPTQGHSFARIVQFVDKAKELKLRPVVRLMTNWGSKGWNKPTDADIPTYSGLVKSLTANNDVYVQLFNEPNRNDQWGGAANAKEYGEYFAKLSAQLKQDNPGIKIVSAGLSPHYDTGLAQSSFISEMVSVPGFEANLNYWGSHSYPNDQFIDELTIASGANEGLKQKYGRGDIKVLITESSSDNALAAITGWADSQSVVGAMFFQLYSSSGEFTPFNLVTDDCKGTDTYNAISVYAKSKGYMCSGYADICANNAGNV